MQKTWKDSRHIARMIGKQKIHREMRGKHREMPAGRGRVMMVGGEEEVRRPKERLTHH